MTSKRKADTSFWTDLKRRRVLSVAAAYAILAWGLVEVASVTLPAFDAPPWVLRAMIIVALAGCPIAIAIAWIFDITPEGLRRTLVDPDALLPRETADSPDESEQRESRGPERRQVCILCCDFTITHSEGHDADPEDLLAETPRYLSLCEQVIERYEGRMRVSATEDVVAYFGADFGHEDDAVRAVMSALAILDGLDALNAAPDDPSSLAVSVKMGLHTGLVLAEEAADGSDNVSIIGQAPKVAAAIQAIAGDREVLISESMYSLVSAFFECEAIERKSARPDLREPLYRVLARSESRSRLENTRLTDLFGREQEVDSLVQRWDAAKGGSGQAVMIRGEPGIGKSRITLAIEDHIRREPDVWTVFCYCSHYYENSALFPIVEWLRRDPLGADGKNESRGSIDSLEAFLAPVSDEYPLDETVPIFAPLLSIGLTDRYVPTQQSADEQRATLLHTLVSIVLMHAQKQPVLVIVEDLHWADPTTVEFMSLLVDNLPRSQILCIMTARTEFVPPWQFKSYVSDLTIGRLSPEQSRRFAEAVAADARLPSSVVDRIVDKTDGIPLFVQELTRASIESAKHSGSGEPGDVTIPNSLKEFLTARVDRLGSSKPLAQLAATIGREFDHALLAAVVEIDKAALQEQLSELIAAEFIYKSGIGAKASYSFRHALFQESAYESLLKSKRKEYHVRIARTLEAEFPERRSENPDILARHFSEAGEVSEAIAYWRAAGKKAESFSAGVEAVHHFRNALRQLAKLPGSAERTATELELQVGLGRAIISSEGYSVDDVRHTYLRVMELCQEVGETPLILDALFGLWANNVTRGKTRESLGMAAQVRQIGEISANDDVIIEADLCTAVSLFQNAEFSDCGEYLDRVLERYDPDRHGQHAAMFGQDPGMSARCYKALLLWVTGHADQSLECARTVIVDARNFDHKHNLAFVLLHLARFYADYGDVEKTEALATECIALSIRPNLGFKTWLSYGHLIHGWARHRSGEREDGLAEMAEGLSLARQINVGSSLTFFLSTYAECCLESGRIDEALSLLQRGYDFINRFGAQAEQTELYRVHAEVLMQQGRDERHRAEELLQTSLRMTEERGAIAYDLRNRISMAKLLRLDGRIEDARSQLAERLARFTEGKKSRDYQGAKSLLNEISS